MTGTVDGARSRSATDGSAGDEYAGPSASTESERTDDTVVGIHQPNYLPWLGYFHKIRHSDVFVFLDDVEYTSNGWTNRNRIKTPDGWTWLTVPVGSSATSIEEVEIVTEEPWCERHRKSLHHSYGKAPYFDESVDLFESVYGWEWDSLAQLNTTLIRRLADRFDVECEFVESSALSVEGTKTDRLIGLCDAVGGDRYLSGTGARSYLEPEAFEAADIALEYQSFDHPTYEQRFDGFESDLSVVDPLFSLGADGISRLLQTGDER